MKKIIAFICMSVIIIILGATAYTLFHIDNSLLEQIYNFNGLDYHIVIFSALLISGFCSVLLGAFLIEAKNANDLLEQKNKLLEQRYKDLDESFNACAVINETILGLVDRSVKDHLAKQYGKPTHQQAIEIV